MPIDVTRARAADPLVQEFTWGPEQVLLYNVGIGAGVGIQAPEELGYLADDPKVLPAFGVIPVTPLIARYNDIPGISVAESSVLHGEHTMEIFRPLEAAGALRSSLALSRVVDKGSAALIMVTIECRDAVDDQLVARHDVSYFVKGEGGAGGPAESRAPVCAPTRAPDHVVRQCTHPNQALIYSLSGDRNPLHISPEAAKSAGLSGPILHGLCTYGTVCKAVVGAMLGGDPHMVVTYSARFTGLVYPGQTVAVSIWDEDDGLLLEATVEETAAVVLRGRMTTTKHGT